MDRDETWELGGPGEGKFHYKVQGPVAIATMDHPETLNSLVPGIMQGLNKAIDEAVADKDVRVLILTGTGRAFCSGADVRSFGAIAEEGISAVGAGAGLGWTTSIVHAPIPVIAAVNGVAAGGGCHLATLCDIRIFGESGRMTEVFARRGLMNESGYALPRIVGWGKAFEMSLTGKMVGAQEALQCGLATEVVPDDKLLPRTIELANEIAEKCAPLAVARIKRALHLSWHLTVEQWVEIMLDGQMALFKTEDVMEGAQSFFEKRKPVWKGK